MYCRDGDGSSVLETPSLKAAYCVACHEQFVGGDAAGGAYQCQLTLSDPDGWTLAAGGPASVFIAPAARAHGLPGAVAAGAASALQNVAIGGGPTTGPFSPANGSSDFTTVNSTSGSLLSLADADYNREWDRTAPANLAGLDLQRTLDHVEYRDYTVPRKRGIGGAHNASEWAKHSSEYVEVTRTAHPTVLGVQKVEYQIFALDPKGKLTGGLVAEIFSKTIYDPQIWPRPRLERGLKEALQNSYDARNGLLTSPWWEGVTHEAYIIQGTNRNGQIGTFFFK